MNNKSNFEFGEEFLLIFVGFGSDAKSAAEVIVKLEPLLQKELDKLRRVNPNVPFNRIKLWKWDSDGAIIKGGQEAVVTPNLARANIAVFVFKEKVGTVTWQELNYALNINPPIPVLPFFISVPPSQDRLMNEDVTEKWLDVIRKSKSLTKDWTNPESSAITPLPMYSDLKHLEELSTERLIAEVVRLSSEFANITTITTNDYKAQSIDLLNFEGQSGITKLMLKAYDTFSKFIK